MQFSVRFYQAQPFCYLNRAKRLGSGVAETPLRLYYGIYIERYPGSDLPPHVPGPWPEGFTVRREQIYDEDGR